MSASYHQMMQGAAQKHALNQDQAMVARVRGIAHRLIPQTAAFRPDAPRWKWEVNLLTSNK